MNKELEQRLEEHWKSKPITLEERFDNACAYWTEQVENGLVKNTMFFKEVFHSPQTELYREVLDDDSLFLIAKTMNESWIGNEKGISIQGSKAIEKNSPFS